MNELTIEIRPRIAGVDLFRSPSIAQRAAPHYPLGAYARINPSAEQIIAFALGLVTAALAIAISSTLYNRESPSTCASPIPVEREWPHRQLIPSTPAPENRSLLVIYEVPRPARQDERTANEGLQARLEWGGDVANDLEETLLNLCNGDRQVFNRLLQHERARQPHLSRSEWLQSAIQRYEQDNR